MEEDLLKAFKDNDINPWDYPFIPIREALRMESKTNLIMPPKEIAPEASFIIKSA